MIKANISFIQEFGFEPIALYYLYQREEAHTLRHEIAAFVEVGGWNAGGFQEWVRSAFGSKEVPAEAVWVKGAYIYFDAKGHRSQASIVFDGSHKEVLIYHWERCVLRADPATALRRLGAMRRA